MNLWTIERCCSPISRRSLSTSFWHSMGFGFESVFFGVRLQFLGVIMQCEAINFCCAFAGFHFTQFLIEWNSSTWCEARNLLSHRLRRCFNCIGALMQDGIFRLKFSLFSLISPPLLRRNSLLLRCSFPSHRPSFSIIRFASSKWVDASCWIWNSLSSFWLSHEEDVNWSRSPWTWLWMNCKVHGRDTLHQVQMMNDFAVHWEIW
jgi:hypothetical protein